MRFQDIHCLIIQFGFHVDDYLLHLAGNVGKMFRTDSIQIRSKNKDQLTHTTCLKSTLKGNDCIYKAKNLYGQNRLQLSTKVQQIMKTWQNICKPEKLCT
jgi:hypothetical protein